MLDEAIEYLKQLQLQVQVSFHFQAMLFWVSVIDNFDLFL